MLVMVSRLLSSKLDISELLTTIMRLASRVVGAERASLYLLDEKAQELYFDVALGLPPEVEKMRFKLGEGIAGTCAKEGRSIIIADAANDPRHSKKADAKSGFQTRSLLTCPMIIKGKVIGVVQAVNRIEGTFEEIDKNNFEAFASQAAIAIENSRLFTSVKEEKRKMEAVVKRVKEGAIVTDMAGEIILINSAAKTYLEQEKYKFTNISGAFQDFEVKPGVDKVTACEDATCNFELFRAKPKKFFMDGTAIKLFKEDKEGNQVPEGKLWILTDVTAQRLEAYMARNFLSLISHKFKTPLASINGFSQILKEEAAKNQGLPEIIKKSSETIHGQGQKLNALVESLLNFVTIDNLGAAELEKMDFDAAEFLTEVAEAAKLCLKEPQAVTIKVVAPEPVAIKADRKLLATAIKAMVDNAVKFNPAKDKLVILSAQARDGFALISVGDNGPGIPGEELENVFQKFYQVEAAFTGQVEGWGLGLALVKKIVEAHNGKVFARSQLQKGSAFTMALPG